jgi:Sap, sulfolipid-1-addressing protein
VLVLGSVYRDLLPWAIAIALTPIAVTAVVMFLGSERGRAKSLALLAGDALTMAVVAAIGVSLGGGEGFAADGTPAKQILIGELIAGLALTGLSAWQIERQLRIRRARREGARQEPPAWLRSIDKVGVPFAFGIGVANMTINVGNLVFTLCGAAAIANHDLTTGEEVAAIFFFVLVATATVWGPIGIDVLMPKRSVVLLDRIKRWIGANALLVLDGILLLIGLNLIGASIAALA